MAHTPGKAMKYDQFVVKVFSENGNMTLIADTRVSSTITRNEAEANAARIVTCWNEYDQLKAENEKVKRLLHNLTPGGSEFYNNPEYCAKWIRENREESVISLMKKIKDLGKENEILKKALTI